MNTKEFNEQFTEIIEQLKANWESPKKDELLGELQELLERYFS